MLTRKKWMRLIVVIVLAEVGCLILGAQSKLAAGAASLMPVLVFAGLIAWSFFKAEPKVKAIRYLGGMLPWFAWNLMTGVGFYIWMSGGYWTDTQLRLLGYHAVPLGFFICTMAVSFCRGFVALLLCQWGVAACYGLALVLPVCSYVLACVMNSKLWDALMGI